MLPRLHLALTTLLSLAFAAVAVPAPNFDRPHRNQLRVTGRKCGNDLTPEAVSLKEKAFASLLAENKASDRFTVAEGSFTVPVTFNIVYASTNASDGYIS